MELIKKLCWLKESVYGYRSGYFLYKLMDFSKRELEIFCLKSNGYKNVEIEEKLGIKQATICAHLNGGRKKVREIMGVHYSLKDIVLLGWLLDSVVPNDMRGEVLDRIGKEKVSGGELAVNVRDILEYIEEDLRQRGYGNSK